MPQDLRWGRAYEGYSSDPKLVASYVGQFIRGLQGEPNAGVVLKGPRVIASTKHFLADGGTFMGRDQGDARIGERDPARGAQQVRFCFCKKDETLHAAAERLQKLRA